MFKSAVETAKRSWFFYEPFVLLPTYKTFQKRFIETYSPYEKLADRYRIVTNREIYPINEEYLTDNKVAEENVALLKNAIELWRSASQTRDAIAPLLFHYSWHCFNAFFAYSFFRWKPQHGSSHGIEIVSETLNEDIMKIMLRFRRQESKQGETKGLFLRLIDTWTLLGASPAFSMLFPIFEGGQIEFLPNQLYLLKESKSLELSQLIIFDPVKNYERKYWRTYGREKLLQNTSFTNSMNLPTRILKGYVILFAASSIARYRPLLWSSIMSGETEDQAAFAFAYRNALLTLSSFLDQISFLMRNVMKGKFELKKLP